MTEQTRGLFSRWRQWRRRQAARTLARASRTPFQGFEEMSYTTEFVKPVRREAELHTGQDEEPLLLAARDDVFEFEVLAHFRWHSHDLSAQRLHERAGELSAAARSELIKRAWELSRTCAADQPAEAERLINAEISDGWCYEDADGLIKCRPTVRVRIDPALRNRMLPLHLEQQVMREQHRLGKLKAEHAQELTEKWLEVVRALEDADALTHEQRQFLLPFVAGLSDKDFAAAAKELRNARSQGARDLADVLRHAARSHEQIGLYEFATAYDRALNSFSQQMGLSPSSLMPTSADLAEDAT
ncbi:hypothetical protein ACIQCD_18545 [Streptomyces sp. NPDC093250]|uniref:hypothetical protein n=1 Tax=Streptomyces sp. NPDC093250 TaxID=3366036 RepID=UPI0038070D39